MKTLLTIILLCNWLFPQDSIIKEIKRNYSLAKSFQSAYKKSIKDLMELSTEGGNATYYRDNDNKIKIVTTELYGEMGMLYDEFYFNNDSLYFYYSEERNYNAPMYYDSTAAKSDGGEPFDVKKTKIEQQRFYFSRNKLIQWLDPQMKSVAKDESYYKKEKDILEFCHLLLK